MSEQLFLQDLSKVDDKETLFHFFEQDGIFKLKNYLGLVTLLGN